MTRLVEISAEAVGGVRSDVASVRDAVDGRWDDLRARAWRLGVPTSGFDDVRAVGDRLGTSVLPVIDTHLERARALAGLRYGGRMGVCLPVVDTTAPPPPAPFALAPLDDGSTELSWAPTSEADVEADREAAERSQGISGWLGDRWDDVIGAASDVGDWIGETAGQAWDAVTEAGAAIGDWWERTTADLGEWIDQNAEGVREFIGRHVGVFRFLADTARVVGWVVVGLGAVLTVALAVVGAMGGGALGAVFGLGVGAAPGGVAGALAGAKIGLTVLGAGFALVSIGDFLDVAADWGEGKIDGQRLVQLGTLELGLAATSLVGLGALGKILQKSAKHLPASWRARIDETLASLLERPRVPEVDEGKFDYLFGRVVSDEHNARRSLQNQRQLQRIGVFDTPRGRAAIETHLREVLADDSNILRTFTTEYGEFQIRESLLAGPRGLLKLETTWQLTADGYRLTTIIPLGGM